MTGMNSQLNLLANALNVTGQNHRVISQNIANANTPGYKTKRIEFDKLMQQIESDQNDNSLQENFAVETVKGLIERIDGNNVDMEKQISELKKNSLIFQSYSHLLASKLATMRRAISS